MSVAASYELRRVEHAHEWEHDCRDKDCDVVFDLNPSVVAAELSEQIRRNPFVAYCRRRGCNHRGSMHEAAGCTVEGCACEEMRE